MRVARNTSSGFTLVEILVALAILAVLSATVLVVSQQVLNNLFRLEEKNFATWIAGNRFVEIKLALPILVSSREVREVDFANRRWEVLSLIENTESPGLQRVTIWVSVEPNNHFGPPIQQRAAAVLSGFLSRE